MMKDNNTREEPEKRKKKGNRGNYYIVVMSIRVPSKKQTGIQQRKSVTEP